MCARTSKCLPSSGPDARTQLAGRRIVIPRVFESNGSGSDKFTDGAKVKVVKPIKVFHVPKHPEINLEGMEGEVQKNCANYKGKVLSPNLPFVVRFQTPVKFLAHMAEDEIEVLQ